jgi:hypothetical protein
MTDLTLFEFEPPPGQGVETLLQEEASKMFGSTPPPPGSSASMGEGSFFMRSLAILSSLLYRIFPARYANRV